MITHKLNPIHDCGYARSIPSQQHRRKVRDVMRVGFDLNEYSIIVRLERTPSVVR